jgi:two-component system, chemotaxis family, chemotaxis protein CheY
MKKILIVDDSHTTRRLISYMLRKNNYVIVEAEDGIDAIEKLSNLQVDLVIADLNMPNMDGIEFVKNLRNNYYFMDIPIIMLTTSRDDQMKRNAFEAGVNMFLNKPIRTDMLLYKVGSLLRDEQ